MQKGEKFKGSKFLYYTQANPGYRIPITKGKRDENVSITTFSNPEETKERKKSLKGTKATKTRRPQGRVLEDFACRKSPRR